MRTAATVALAVLLAVLLGSCSSFNLGAVLYCPAKAACSLQTVPLLTTPGKDS